jgi:hypothetical protein
MKYQRLPILESMTRFKFFKTIIFKRIQKPFRPPESFSESVDTDKEVLVNPDKIRGWQRQHRCWEGKGSLAARWKELEPRLIKELDQTISDSNRGVSAPRLVYFMVGREVACAQPVVFIVDGNSGSRQEAFRAIRKSRILTEAVPGFTLAVLETSPRGKICLVAMENLVTTHSQKSTQPSVYVDSRDEFYSVGMPVYVSNELGSIRKATANLVYNGQRYGFITAAHALQATSEQDINTSNSVRNRNKAEDDDEADDEDEVLGLSPGFDSYEAERQYDTYARECLPCGDACSRPESYISDAPSQSTNHRLDDLKHGGLQYSNDQGDLISNGFDEVRLSQSMESMQPSSDTHYRLLGSIEGRLDSSDCMLISKALEQTTSESDPELERTHEVQWAAPEKPTTVIALTSHGAVSGLLSDVPSLMMLPGTKLYQGVYTIVCEEEIKMGDCGTMVVDKATNKLYGFIFGYTEVGRVAYMMTAEHIVPVIKESGNWSLHGVEQIRCKFFNPIYRSSAALDPLTDVLFYSEKRLARRLYCEFE